MKKESYKKGLGLWFHICVYIYSVYIYIVYIYIYSVYIYISRPKEILCSQAEKFPVLFQSNIPKPCTAPPPRAPHPPKQAPHFGCFEVFSSNRGSVHRAVAGKIHLQVGTNS